MSNLPFVENPSVALRFVAPGALHYVDLADASAPTLAYRDDDERLHALARDEGVLPPADDPRVRALGEGAVDRWHALVQAKVYCPLQSGMHIQYGPSQYLAMLANTERMLPYLNALALQVKPGDVVMEVGAGLGVFAMFAAKLGAEVIAVEPGGIAGITRSLLRENGLEGRVKLVTAMVEDLPPLERKADLIVTEFIGRNVFDERVLRFAQEVKKHLAPGGRLVPGRLSARLQAVQCEELRRELQRQRGEVSELGKSVGLNLDAFQRTIPSFHQAELLQRTHYTKGRVQYDALCPVSGEGEIVALDLMAGGERPTQGTVTLEVEEDGFVDALRLSFEADLGQGVALSSALFSPPLTSVQQDCRYLPASGPRRFYRRGEQLTVDWAYLGDRYGEQKQESSKFATRLR